MSFAKVVMCFLAATLVIFILAISVDKPVGMMFFFPKEGQVYEHVMTEERIRITNVKKDTVYYKKRKIRDGTDYGWFHWKMTKERLKDDYKKIK